MTNSPPGPGEPGGPVDTPWRGGTEVNWRGTVGSARLHTPAGRVIVEATGGEQPISISVGGSAFELAAIPPAVLPTADEQFAVGDTLHINYPQSATRFALRLALDLVKASAELFVLELRISVQTDLLDAHPAVRLRRVAHAETPSEPPNCAIVMTAAEAAHSERIDDDTWNLFGEFLEKGVIRRARPWLIAGKNLDADTLARWTERLERSPTPLGA